MRAIRRKIKLVFFLLALAFATSALIYSRGGFSIDGGDSSPAFFCGTAGPDDVITDKIALRGRVLFRANCTSCHTMDKKLVGPALMGMQDRAPYKDFIEDLLLYPKRTVKRNLYASALSRAYKDIGHMNFNGILSKADVQDVIRYAQLYKPVSYEVIAEP